MVVVAAMVISMVHLPFAGGYLTRLVRGEAQTGSGLSPYMCVVHGRALDAPVALRRQLDGIESRDGARPAPSPAGSARTQATYWSPPRNLSSIWPPLGSSALNATWSEQQTAG